MAACISSRVRRHLYTASLSSSSLSPWWHAPPTQQQGKQARHRCSCAHRQQPLRQQTRGFRSSRPAAAPAAEDDYYKVLGVTKSASPADIKKAYFAQAKKFHPDQNQGSDDAKRQFQKVTEAYEVLGNAEKKTLYDQYGKAGVDPNNVGGAGGDPFGGFGGSDPFGGFGSMRGQTINVDPNDVFGMFEEIFGARGFQQRQRGPRRGQDLQIGISVSFFEAVFGAQKQVNVTYRSRGKQGRKITKTVPVQLPPGADNGMAFTLSGEGAESDSKGGPNGDLLIQIAVAEDPYFKREGPDIHIEAPITFLQAVLGGKVDVLTLDGVVELTIPPGTSPDTVLLMRRRGARHLQSERKGDQYVHVKVHVPKPSELSSEQKTLIQAFHDAEHAAKDSTQSGGSKSAFDSIGKTMRDAFSRLTGFKSSQSESKDSSSPKDSDTSSSDADTQDTKKAQSGGA